jgi:high affinity sulfate transporter 1
VYKVGYPPQKNLATEFTDTLRETFFHDNPLRQYKGQSGWTRFMLGLQFLFPAVEWGRNYNFNKFKSDLIAGLTIASLCIPQVSRMTNPPSDLNT